jgi:hypothetical protein
MDSFCTLLWQDLNINRNADDTDWADSIRPICLIRVIRVPLLAFGDCSANDFFLYE